MVTKFKMKQLYVNPVSHNHFVLRECRDHCRCIITTAVGRWKSNPEVLRTWESHSTLNYWLSRIKYRPKSFEESYLSWNKFNSLKALALDGNF